MLLPTREGDDIFKVLKGKKTKQYNSAIQECHA
jgi:hypothetical protein